MKLNPLTTRKILKGLAVTSGFIAVSGIITSSILGCVAFAQLQNLVIPKPVEEEKDLVLQGDPQTPKNTESIKNLDAYTKTIAKVINSNNKVLEKQQTTLMGALQGLTVMLEEQKTKLRDLDKKWSEASISLVDLEDRFKGFEQMAGENYAKVSNLENEIEELKGDIETNKNDIKDSCTALSDLEDEVDEIKEEVGSIRAISGINVEESWPAKELKRLDDKIELERKRNDEQDTKIDEVTR